MKQQKKNEWKQDLNSTSGKIYKVYEETYNPTQQHKD